MTLHLQDLKWNTIHQVSNDYAPAKHNLILPRIFLKGTCILVPECANVPLVGNGFCNDETNNAECNYDDGDCCGNVNTDYCLDCACYNQQTCEGGDHPLVGNGYCNDQTNTFDCNYDGGDCCGTCINFEYCTECQCLSGFEGYLVMHDFIGNGYCNDETNNEECMFDGGDCCGFDEYGDGDYDDYYDFEADISLCTECTCHGMYKI